MMDKGLFDDLMASIREAGAVVRGDLEPARVTGRNEAAREAPAEDVDARLIRHRLALTRSQFAVLIGVSERTIEGWEQGRRRPSGPALTLLRIAAKHPESVLDAMLPRLGR